ncbi:hypothetical protein CDAR_170091 [Caerostris darwini]|uniref:Uncharacterized protein n=1 Tax=Caerostris darwini TaxID=1538125 RepID=A0AAV4RRE0_9ARAC|nr:hypothetical protein CDAR_170091 [Caerostris darwini]
MYLEHNAESSSVPLSCSLKASLSPRLKKPPAVIRLVVIPLTRKGILSTLIHDKRTNLPFDYLPICGLPAFCVPLKIITLESRRDFKD